MANVIKQGKGSIKTSCFPCISTSNTATIWVAMMNGERETTCPTALSADAPTAFRQKKNQIGRRHSIFYWVMDQALIEVCVGWWDQVEVEVVL